MSEVPAAPAPQPVAPVTYPGKTLGIVGLIVTFFASIIGLILSIVAFNQSKAAGYKNTPAKVGIILGIVFFVLTIIIIIVSIAAAAAIVSSVCNGVDPGVYQTTSGTTVTCG